ncbi:MAG TPA: Wzz/FepE/Etk N-terminal domain-containing protein [Candidatus Acidoferrales bacterium]|nr:Wzz/FepE/Etk N-terminal domain-containing protein [Candidatus Acidoferrales bacterium]
MTNLLVKAEKAEPAARTRDGLLIDAVDEQTLRMAREQNAARVRVLWNNRKFLLRSAVGGLVVATALAFLLPTRYTASAGLMPPNNNGTGSNLMTAMLASRVGGGLASLAQGALGIQTTGALFIEILKSDTVRDDVIQKFDLQKVYGTRYMADARTELLDHTGISEDEKSGVITINVVDHDPKRAAAMAQEYVNELNWVVNNLSTSSAHRERDFLDSRLTQVKADLESAEQQFSQFASKKGAIDIPEQGKAMVTAAATLQGQLIAAESELQGFRQIYTDNNARVRSLQARVNELRGSLEKIAGTNASEKSSIQQLYPSLRELPLLGVGYADLLRHMKVEEAVFETLTQEDELAKVEEAKEIPSVRVLDPPEVPQKKSFPPRMTLIALGTFLGFVLGATWILTNSAWKAIDPNDPRKSVATEVWTDVRASLPWNHQNGSPNGGPKHWLRKSLHRNNEIDSGK